MGIMDKKTLTRAAEDLGISVSTLCNLFKKRRGVSWKLAKKLTAKAPLTTITMWMDRDVKGLKKALNLK